MATTLQDTLWGCVTELEYAGKLLQLQTITQDNTAVNTTICEMVESLHGCWNQQWDVQENQL
ncbi:hypothetical protein AX14_003339, partial [Amanita brunnescens Koide BX004]